MPQHFQDELDQRLSAALESVDVPTGLRAKIAQALDAAALAEQQGLVQLAAIDGPVKVDGPLKFDGPVNPVARTKLSNRRMWIAATVAAGIGGTWLGFRQLTQPLSQSWLLESCTGLLAQIEPDGSSWQAFEGDAGRLRSDTPNESRTGSRWQASNSAEVVFLREIGFLRQVRGVGLVGFCKLRASRNIEEATAYNLGADGRGGLLILLDLVVERGVQGLTRSLTELPQNRSDAYSLAAMQAGDRLLVMAGHVDLDRYILRGQTI